MQQFMTFTGLGRKPLSGTVDISMDHKELQHLLCLVEAI